ncbi:MAG: glycerophosphodiester phosphodiesterase family protein [Pseudomonadota bacterium]
MSRTQQSFPDQKFQQRCLKAIAYFCTLLALISCDDNRSTDPKNVALPGTIEAVGWQIAKDFPADGRDLNDFFDCVEEANATLVSAHRGGPQPGFPENAIETFANILKKVPVLIEIDVAMSRDGVALLMHDDDLDRTTTGQGKVHEQSWRDIQSLNLVDKDGRKTAFSPPSFSRALAFLKDRTITQVDFKRSAKYETVIDEIYHLGAEHRVILIAYSIGQARKLHRLAPEMMISLAIKDIAVLSQIQENGLPLDSILAFTGTDQSDADLNASLNDKNIEVIFGTLGGRNSIDQKFARNKGDLGYIQLADQGVDLIATDRPQAVARTLLSAGRLPKNLCGIGSS